MIEECEKFKKLRKGLEVKGSRVNAATFICWVVTRVPKKVLLSGWVLLEKSSESYSLCLLAESCQSRIKLTLYGACIKSVIRIRTIEYATNNSCIH